jgi:hypothetical protein
LSLDNDSIVEWLDQMEKETKALKSEILKMCWFMRGGLDYEQAVMLSNDERVIISDLIKENMETTKKSGLPFF